MSKFVTGKALNDAIYRIIWEAKQSLMLVSPFIRFDEYFKKLLLKHKQEPGLHIILVFGKNEGQVNKSLKKEDFEFLKNFPNISVIYAPNLHGKYYGNENEGVITSINLHDHSFDNNIEFGVHKEVSILDKITGSADIDAWQYCYEVANENEPVYIARPSYQKNLLSVLLGKNYVKTEILLDKTSQFYSRDKSKNETSTKLADYPSELEFKAISGQMPSKEMPVKDSPTINFRKDHTKGDNVTTDEVPTIKATGYCIRTGKEIEFNPKYPLSYDAYKEWAQYQNYDYPEKYCHRTGEKTFGKNSFRKPILKDNFQNKERSFSN